MDRLIHARWPARQNRRVSFSGRQARLFLGARLNRPERTVGRFFAGALRLSFAFVLVLAHSALGADTRCELEHVPVYKGCCSHAFHDATAYGPTLQGKSVQGRQTYANSFGTPVGLGLASPSRRGGSNLLGVVISFPGGVILGTCRVELMGPGPR